MVVVERPEVAEVQLRPAGAHEQLRQQVRRHELEEDDGRRPDQVVAAVAVLQERPRAHDHDGGRIHGPVQEPVPVLGDGRRPAAQRAAQWVDHRRQAGHRPGEPVDQHVQHDQDHAEHPGDPAPGLVLGEGRALGAHAERLLVGAAVADGHDEPAAEREQDACEREPRSIQIALFAAQPHRSG